MERYDRQFSLIHAERTTRQIQIFMKDLNSKLVDDFYERTTKELPIYHEFIEFKMRKISAPI